MLLREIVSLVLVETSESLNIGSASRSMMNFGLTDLRLVSPRSFLKERAAITACGAREPLDAARVFPTLAEALADRDYVVGFSARLGKQRGECQSLATWIESGEGINLRKVALVFGPEDNGLRQEHIEQCTSLIYIPTEASYPSMNLSHAISVALYCIAEKFHGGRDLNRAAEERVTWNEFATIDAIVQEVAELSGFFHSGTPQPVPSVVKNIFRRLNLTKREMAIIVGLFSNAKKAIQGKIPVQTK